MIVTIVLAWAGAIVFLPAIAVGWLVSRYGVTPGLWALGAMIVWTAFRLYEANALFSDQTVMVVVGEEEIHGYSPFSGLMEFAWALFVFVPSCILTAIGLLIGRKNHRRAQVPQ